MNILVGLFMMAAAVGVFLSRERFLAANKASTGALFGRADPHRIAPRFTQVWNRAIVIVVTTVLFVVGALIVLGVVDLADN